MRMHNFFRSFIKNPCDWVESYAKVAKLLWLKIFGIKTTVQPSLTPKRRLLHSASAIVTIYFRLQYIEEGYSLLFLYFSPHRSRGLRYSSIWLHHSSKRFSNRGMISGFWFTLWSIREQKGGEDSWDFLSVLLNTIQFLFRCIRSDILQDARDELVKKIEKNMYPPPSP